MTVEQALASDFAWEWSGPETVWELVVLDEDLLEAARSAPTISRSYRPEGAVASVLARGGRFLWFVEGRIEGQGFRCIPVPIRIAK